MRDQRRTWSPAQARSTSRLSTIRAPFMREEANLSRFTSASENAGRAVEFRQSPHRRSSVSYGPAFCRDTNPAIEPPATSWATRRTTWTPGACIGWWPRYAANPGLTPSFRRSLPETGCLSQGLPHGKRFARTCPPKTVKHPDASPQGGGTLCFARGLSPPHGHRCFDQFPFRTLQIG